MPPEKEKFELVYDPAKVRESLAAARARRGVKVVTRPVVSSGTRIGNYMPQSEKRKAYHNV